MNAKEKLTFERIFKKYVERITKDQHSLLARIYGIYTVEIENLKPVHLILMGNTLKLADKKHKLTYLFDLKGSIIKRKTHNPKPSSTLKDQNLLEIKLQQNILKFDGLTKNGIMTWIKEDLEVLKFGNIMD